MAPSKSKAGAAKQGKSPAGGSASSGGGGDPVENSRHLPTKEASLFRQIVKFYETKQYKKGLKAADQILKKFPEHGETLSMKGLTFNCLERKDEAYEFVRRGLKLDLKSHVCWHVYGLLYRSDHEYREAIKCYMNALRLDKENIQILRDLSLLQIQMRDLSGFVETRRQLLTLKPGQKNHWIAFAVAHHLVSNHDMAVHVLDAYANTTDGQPSSGENEDGAPMTSQQKHAEAYETSEMIMYKVRILEEGGKYAEAIEILLKDEAKGAKKRSSNDSNGNDSSKSSDTQGNDANKPHADASSRRPRGRRQILDQLSAKEALGRMLLKSNRKAEAEKVYRELIERNPENTIYHDGLFESIGLPRMSPAQSCIRGDGEPAATSSSCASVIPLAQRKQLVGEYVKLKKAHPTCIAYDRRVIDLHEPGDDPDCTSFRSAVDSYVRPWLSKGIPSLFKSLQQLYLDQRKAEIIGELFEGYEKSLNETRELPPPLSASDKAADSKVVPPSTSPDVLLWVLVYLTQHYDHMRDVDKALEKVDKAIAHTPTVIELYSIKAKIMKHAGHPVSAAVLADHARQLDLADRYLNSKAVKYFFRSGQVQEANEVAILFTKDNTPLKSQSQAAQSQTPPDPLASLKNLNEMQCFWYEYECGMAHKREGLNQLGKSLSKLLSLLKHFDDIHEDQFDFHSYCMRKMTLRAYVDVLGFEDRLFGHEYYAKGAVSTIECYISLFDDPPSKRREQERLEEEAKMASMAPNERKKYKAKLRKQAAAAEQSPPASSKVDHLDPEKLLYTEDPLGEATKILNTLQKYQKPPQLATQILAFEIAMRRQKVLLALQSVQRAARIDSTHPDVHRSIVTLVKHQEQPQNKAQHPVVAKILKESIAGLLSGASLEDYCRGYLTQHCSQSPKHCYCAIEQVHKVGANQDSKNLLKTNLLSKTWFDRRRLQDRSTSHQGCVEVHTMLSQSPWPEVASEWKSLCATEFRYSSYFEGSQSKSLKENPKSVIGCVKALEKLEIL